MRAAVSRSNTQIITEMIEKKLVFSVLNLINAKQDINIKLNRAMLKSTHTDIQLYFYFKTPYWPQQKGQMSNLTCALNYLLMVSYCVTFHFVLIQYS